MSAGTQSSGDDPRVKAVYRKLRWQHVFNAFDEESRDDLVRWIAQASVAAADAVQDRPCEVCSQTLCSGCGEPVGDDERMMLHGCLWHLRCLSGRDAVQPSREELWQEIERLRALDAPAISEVRHLRAERDALREALRAVYGWLPGLIPGVLLEQVAEALSGSVPAEQENQ